MAEPSMFELGAAVEGLKQSISSMNERMDCLCDFVQQIADSPSIKELLEEDEDEDEE